MTNNTKFEQKYEKEQVKNYSNFNQKKNPFEKSSFYPKSTKQLRKSTNFTSPSHKIRIYMYVYILKSFNLTNQTHSSILFFKMAKILPLIFLLVVATIGFSNGHEVGIFELKRGDFSIQLTNYGATILSVILPDKNGSFLFLFLR